jgi:hypothetical protein
MVHLGAVRLNKNLTERIIFRLVKKYDLAKHAYYFSFWHRT